MVNVETEDLEVFKIGRTRIIFPPDITEDELQFISMMMYNYIQTQKYKATHHNIWKISDRLEEKIKKVKNDAGVS